LTQTIQAVNAPAGIVGVDSSKEYVAYAREQLADPRFRFEVADARALSFDPATFDAVVSGLVLNFVPSPDAAVAEMARVARPGGTVGAYVWDYAGKMELLRYFWDVAVALDPEAGDLDEGRRFPLCQPELFTQLFRANGLKAIEFRPIDVPTIFRDFDDYWLPFLGGQGLAPDYTTSLTEDRRTALRERLRATLPRSSGGSIALTAWAWGVHCIR
jgi:SAM-dependent methyltransferase